MRRRHLPRQRPAGTAELFIDVPDGRTAVSMAADLTHELLFVAGGFTGQTYVYDTRSGPPWPATSWPTGATFVNDVAVTQGGVWFTDSAQAKLYFVPISQPGSRAIQHT